MTAKKPFYPTGDDKIYVAMMKTRRPVRAVFKRMELFGANVLKLPFAGRRMSLILILPKKRHQLATVAEKIMTIGVKKLLQDLDEAARENKTVKVKVFLPKFTSTKRLRLNSPLKHLGITDMFSRKADFQKMMEDKTEDMRVSEVSQRTFLPHQTQLKVG